VAHDIESLGHRVYLTLATPVLKMIVKDRFITAFNSRQLMTHVRLRAPSTIDDALEAAQQYESASWSVPRDVALPGILTRLASLQRDDDGPCWYSWCGRGHFARDCSSRPKNNRFPRSPRRSQRDNDQHCSRSGSRSRSATEESSGRSRSDSDSHGPSSEEGCYLCSVTGHRVLDCPQLDNARPDVQGE